MWVFSSQMCRPCGAWKFIACPLFHACGAVLLNQRLPAWAGSPCFILPAKLLTQSKWVLVFNYPITNLPNYQIPQVLCGSLPPIVFSGVALVPAAEGEASPISILNCLTSSPA